MCVSVLYTCVPVYCVCLVPAKTRRSSGNGVTDSIEDLYEHWNLNLGSLEEHPRNC